MTEEELNKKIEAGEVGEVNKEEPISPVDENEIGFLQPSLEDYESFLNLLRKLKLYGIDVPTHTPKSFIEQFYFHMLGGAGGVANLYVHFNDTWNKFVTDHGGLLGLTDDDHVGYLLASGARSMTGDIDMGGNDVTNVTLVDGVDVSAHASDATIHFTEGAIDHGSIAGLNDNDHGAIYYTEAEVDAMIETKYLGVGKAVAKTYFNFTMPWRIMAANEVVWDVTNLTISEQSLAHIKFNTTAGGDGYLETQDPLFGLTFATSKDIILELVLQITTNTHTTGWGLGTTADDFGASTWAADIASVHFSSADDGKLWACASTGDGTNHTESEITGITQTNKNLYRIEWNPGTDAKFYVNGTLKATITTNLPATGNTKFGIGIQGDAVFASAPHFAIEI